VELGSPIEGIRTGVEMVVKGWSSVLRGPNFESLDS